jgi:hypothetical protein
MDLDIFFFFFFFYPFIDSSKSSEDVVKEGQILKEMLEIVVQRDSLIALLEEDRQRCGLPLKHGCVQQSLSGPAVLQHFQTVLRQRVSSKESFSLIWLLVILAVMWALSYIVVGTFCSLSLAEHTL